MTKLNTAIIDKASPKEKTFICLIENNKITRADLRECFNSFKSFKVNAETTYCDKDYLEKIYTSKANIVVLSSFRGEKESLDKIKEINKNMPLVKSIVMTDKLEEQEFCSSVLSGARAYCNQLNTSDEMERILNKVANGECYFDDSMSNFIYRVINHMGQMSQFPIDKPLDEQVRISQREYEVINAILRTNSQEEAAKLLFITKNTVKMHLKKIYRKLNVNTQLKAILKLQSRLYEFKFEEKTVK